MALRPNNDTTTTKTRPRRLAPALLLACACCCCAAAPRPAAAYTVAGCVLTLTAADKAIGYSRTNVLWIDGNAKLQKIAADVNNCTASADGAGGWRVVGGGVTMRAANDVTDLEALKDLRAIEGKDTAGYGLLLSNNAKLASLAGLRNLRGSLKGALVVFWNDVLASLSGLEGITRIDGQSSDGKSLSVSMNDALCLPAADRARLTSCAGTACSAAECAKQTSCDGRALVYDGGAQVQAAQEPDGSKCTWCGGGRFSGGFFSVSATPKAAACLTDSPTASPTAPVPSPTPCPPRSSITVTNAAARGGGSAAATAAAAAALAAACILAALQQ